MLRVELEELCGVFLRLLHVEVGGRGDVGEQVGALVRRDVGVYVAEFAFEHAEAVRDEVGGGAGNLVLVVDPAFLIYVNDGGDDVFGALGVDIAVGDGDERTLVVDESGADAGLDDGRHHVVGAVFDVEGLSAFGEECLEAGLGHDADFTHGGVDDGVVLSLDGGFLFLVVEGEAAHFEGVPVEMEGELSVVLSGEAVEDDLHGELFAVEGDAVEASVGFVADIQPDALAGLGEDGGRLDDGELVVDVTLVHADARLGEERVEVAAAEAGVVLLFDEDGRCAFVGGLCGQEVPQGSAAAEDD